jgi:hypothetical protein
LYVCKTENNAIYLIKLHWQEYVAFASYVLYSSPLEEPLENNNTKRLVSGQNLNIQHVLDLSVFGFPQQPSPAQHV